MFLSVNFGKCNEMFTFLNFGKCNGMSYLCKFFGKSTGMSTCAVLHTAVCLTATSKWGLKIPCWPKPKGLQRFEWVLLCSFCVPKVSWSVKLFTLPNS